MNESLLERELQVFQSKAKTLACDEEIMTLRLRTVNYFFQNVCFEILDEEILELISNGASNAFLYNDEEDIYSINDGEPV